MAKKAAVAEKPVESRRQPSGNVPNLIGGGDKRRILFTDPDRAEQGEFCYDYFGSGANDKAAREYLESLGYTIVARGVADNAYAGSPNAGIMVEGVAS